MNLLRKSAIKCMSGLEHDAGKLSARFTFPDAFIGFQGHFPAAKVLPGICQMECAAGMIESWSGRPVRIVKVINAKFLAPVLPSEEILFECSTVASSGEFDIKAKLTRAGIRVSDIKLRVALEGGPR